MLDTPTPNAGNTLLAALSSSDIDLLEPSFECVGLNIGEQIYKAHEKVEYAYFPLSGICSVIAENYDGVKLETGLIGREGFIGIPIIHYVEKIASTITLQAEGRALRLLSSDLLKAIQKSPSLNATLLRYAHIFALQVSQTAIANGHHTIDRRLARWLLMCQDRVESPEFPMTHQFLSNMLAVRRAGITDALTDLEGKKAIRAMRGHIVVLNRSILQEIAGGAYGVPEDEYRKLIPAPSGRRKFETTEHTIETVTH